MDIFTHALLPLALYAALRRPWPECLAAGLGAAMPDMDLLLSWAQGLDDRLYFTVHRGWSHTLWGAPLFAVLGLALLSRPWWRTRLGGLGPRFAAFQLAPLTLLAVLLGAWSHLLLDWPTLTGVAALWPFSLQRATLNLYFFGVFAVTPVSAWVFWRLLRGTLTRALLLRAAALVAVALLATAGLREATLPRDVPAGAVVVPTPNDLRWIVAEPEAGGWVVHDHDALAGDGEAHEFLGNLSEDAIPAVVRAQALGTYAAWAWNHPAPVLNSTRLADGWRIEFRDAVMLHRNATGGWLAELTAEPEPLVVEVHGERAVVAARPTGFGF
ncbi:MAG: metal-dependent hydrolase [Halobacteriales archaeon]|nr:metal-dependent hydrolase [Halobacteriales archaeon]